MDSDRRRPGELMIQILEKDGNMCGYCTIIYIYAYPAQWCWKFIYLRHVEAKYKIFDLRWFEFWWHSCFHCILTQITTVWWNPSTYKFWLVQLNIHSCWMHERTNLITWRDYFSFHDFVWLIHWTNPLRRFWSRGVWLPIMVHNGPYYK